MRFLRALFSRRRVERDLDEEFQFHLERLVEQNAAAGLAPEEARAEALRELGGVVRLKEECRDARGFNLLDHLLQDVRYGLRMLRAHLLARARHRRLYSDARSARPTTRNPAAPTVRWP